MYFSGIHHAIVRIHSIFGTHHRHMRSTNERPSPIKVHFIFFHSCFPLKVRLGQTLCGSFSWPSRIASSPFWSPYSNSLPGLSLPVSIGVVVVRLLHTIDERIYVNLQSALASTFFLSDYVEDGTDLDIFIMSNLPTELFLCQVFENKCTVETNIYIMNIHRHHGTRHSFSSVWRIMNPICTCGIIFHHENVSQLLFSSPRVSKRDIRF